LAGGKWWPQYFTAQGNALPQEDELAPHMRPSLTRAAKICAITISLWLLPIILAAVFLGREHTIFREGIFFSKAALVTFGGAYAVLPYVSQQAVENYHWLHTGQMLDGLGLAETTPGPLIMVLQFVGFLGGWNHPGNLSPLMAATLGALITTWVTFTPCFLWIFLGAPYIEKLRNQQQLTAALSGVTAAVVGVILNLAVWFGIHVLLPAGRIDWFALGIFVLGFVGMLRWKWNIIPVILGSALAGLLFQLLTR
jgi:chromate transporter